MKKHRQHLSFANVTSILALFVALSGSAYAIGKVGSKDIKREAVKSKHVEDGSLLAEDFAFGQLPAGAAGAPGQPGAPGAPGSDASSPTGAVSFFNLASCPSGWSELTAARGRYVVGLPAGGSLAGIQGTPLANLENRAVGSHTHPISDPGHVHQIQYATFDDAGTNWVDLAGTGTVASGAFTTNSALTGIGINAPAGTTAGTNAPYIQLLVCQKS